MEPGRDVADCGLVPGVWFPSGLVTSLGTCYLDLAGARKDVVNIADLTGDELLRVLATLANPHRLRVVAALAQQRNYVSQLARELGISRALLQVHLRKLQAAGLVSAVIEVSEDGKAMKFYEVTPFTIQLTPKEIMAAVTTLTAGSDPDSEVGHE
jgi:DNA-binding transcriptional ArsR family regulator